MRSTQAPSCTHRIDAERRLAYAKLYGEVDGPFIASCVRTVRAEPGWSDSFDVIWDERDITILDVTPCGLEEMVDAQTSGQTGNDIIVSNRRSRDLIHQLYAMRARARGRPAEVFRTLNEALDFLGLSELPPELRLA